MPDQSHLDDKYFIDQRIYNCPYCNRRHVSYKLQAWQTFDWADSKTAHAYFVICQSCVKMSMHLSYSWLLDGSQRFRSDVEIDDHIFYSVPSSFHVINEHIPAELRELIAEAEGCLKSNFLTGASACVRKVVYELAAKHDAKGANYEDRIKALKDLLPHVDSAYFDTLLTIQQLTSDKVHEESYDRWQSKHLRLTLAALLEALNEIYVVPKQRAAKRQGILQLKSDVFGPKATSTTTARPDES